MKFPNSSRRAFIKKNSLAGLSVIAMSSIAGCSNATKNSRTASISSADKGKIGTMTLEQLRDQTKEALFNRFLPNMESLVIDHEYGGFMCNVAIDTRKLQSTNKSAWYEGRGMWAYSFLYNNFGRDPRYLEVARKSKDFILKHQPNDNSFWISSYSREGKPLSGPGDIYCSLFISEGLAEYAKASGERQYLELAKKIMLSALARYDQADYRYPITYGPAHAQEIPAPRVLGHWMVFLRSATQFLQQESDPEIEKIAARAVDAIMKHHLNPEYRLLNEGLNHDLTLPDNEWAQFAYLGHGCETLWMVMDEAVRRKDAALFHAAEEAFKRHVSVATDAVEGGFFRALDNVGDYLFKVDKVLWLQEEVLNGTLLMIEHSNDEWARAGYAKTYAYIQEKFVHPEYAFVVESGDRSMANYHKTRAEHYHHPRRLMLNLLGLERIIKRGGNVSGLFS